MRYTVRTVPALLARAKPWQDYAAAAQSLRGAISRFTKSAAVRPGTGASGAPRARARRRGA
jgi:hypothetical protein